MKLDEIREICRLLGIKGDVVDFSVLDSGHINSTFKVVALKNDKKTSYIVQKINTYVFRNPKALMSNILAVTNFMKNKVPEGSPVTVLNYLSGENDTGFVTFDDGCYRAYEFVKNSVTFDITDCIDIIHETGYGFGEFQRLLSDFPAEILHETISNFHNTPSRFLDFEYAIFNNLAGRVGTFDQKHETSVDETIKEFLNLREVASEMYEKYLAGEIPSRVTHNDTKCNNILFDKVTRKHICVIDLDTVMPGLAGFDFGDGVRFIASTSVEDEKNLKKVKLDLGKFEAFTKGFLDGSGNVFTEEEIKTLPLGAITITIECGVRFLTDFLNGDTYFKIDYPEHNLTRARCQLQLAKDMISKRQVMNQIVARHRGLLKNCSENKDKD